MGLDIYYLKATLTPAQPEEAHNFRVEDFDDYALDMLGFRRFIQSISHTVYPTSSIQAVKDERALRFLRAHDEFAGLLEDGIEVEVLGGDPSSLKRRVEHFEGERGLDCRKRLIVPQTLWIDRTGYRRFRGDVWVRPLDEGLWEPSKSVLEEIRQSPPADHPPVQLISIYYGVPEPPYWGLYAEEVGYQRKGMSAAFYKEFGSPTWYVRRSDVERAGDLLDPSGTPEKNRERQENFAARFLDPFEEGVSIFSVSW